MTADRGIGSLFSLEGRVAVITGGAGLLGRQHADIIARAGGNAVIVDIASARPADAAAELTRAHGGDALGIVADITDPSSVDAMRAAVLERFGRVDILINNAANNPKVEAADGREFSRLEHFPLAVWEDDLRVGLTGAFLCSRALGAEMARCGRGSIVNIASDLGIIAPDQRLYRIDGVDADRQPVKPVTYSVVKSGLIGLTRYLATYWNECGVRVNALSPGGVANGQPDEFVVRLNRLIPLGRMAHVDEYQGAILFLSSDASSYMTGSNLVIDGGRTSW